MRYTCLGLILYQSPQLPPFLPVSGIPIWSTFGGLWKLVIQIKIWSNQTGPILIIKPCGKFFQVWGQTSNPLPLSWDFKIAENANHFWRAQREVKFLGHVFLVWGRTSNPPSLISLISYGGFWDEAAMPLNGPVILDEFWKPQYMMKAPNPLVVSQICGRFFVGLGFKTQTQKNVQSLSWIHKCK